MIKPSTPSKQTVPLHPEGEAKPSRIRRDPPPPEQKLLKSVRAYPTERETWTVVIGVVLFALALTIIMFGFSDFTNG